uniref:Uncharacterized protein n=1 Tax=Lactuca sativa TaxID=4236 RepID=A0A9R1VYK0_LACSA|nr:hypothetical protein LSAT_V11C400201000 [Lactuca sativa]
MSTDLTNNTIIMQSEDTVEKAASVVLEFSLDVEEITTEENNNVDTNVGRIVVRPGWVPLQPLPESLQLHLLEMYLVLHSIQKYLWPILCKLDQLTLYELHYQMITFGKVFCTKSKPSYNACPMRAECRNFASAFASARLALPGLEEKKR